VVVVTVVGAAVVGAEVVGAAEVVPAVVAAVVAGTVVAGTGVVVVESSFSTQAWIDLTTAVTGLPSDFLTTTISSSAPLTRVVNLTTTKPDGFVTAVTLAAPVGFFLASSTVTLTSLALVVFRRTAANSVLSPATLVILAVSF